MKKILIKRYLNNIKTTQNNAQRMKTRSMSKNTKVIDKQEEHKFLFNRKEFESDQDKRKLAGSKPINITIFGNLYVWYPPL
jgi:hypothetical protein